MRYILILLVFLAAPVQAQTGAVSVKSGDHSDFTRLVLTFPAPVDWTLGRTGGGYGLRLAEPGLRYDLASVYRVITKERLRSVWVDPAMGDLILGVDCPCHAVPFELDPRTLVIDIKDGPPPQGSSFELSLGEGTIAAPIQPVPVQRPRQNTRRDGGYDWLKPDAASTGRETPPEVAASGLEPDLKLEDFRSMLIDEVGRGATEGVVEMEQRLPPPDPVTGPLPETIETALPENARAAINALPGIGITSDADDPPDLMVRGDTCPKAADLDLGSWAGSGDAASELALARAAVLTEFDVPDPQSVTQAANTHLHFGFGAEARLLMLSFLPSGEADRLRVALSYLVDGDTPPDNPFHNMQSCDSGAALWALLAAPAGEALSFVNGAAVSRSFLSLPAPLRAAIGPETAKRLLTSGDSANAEVVRQSFERAVAPDDPTVELLTADQALQKGDPAGAEAALPTSATGETAMGALFTLVEARFQQLEAVDGKDILALEAFAFEHGSGPLRPRLDRALAHAKALSGDFAAAFAIAGENAALEQDLWMLLGETGPESQLLVFAVGLAPDRRAALPVATRSKIAERLIGAGLPNAAAEWAQSGDLDPELTARIALANGDPRTAMRLLAARLPDADPDLLATSYTALGDYDTAATTYQTAGNTDAATRLQRWAGTWTAPAETVVDTPPEDPATSSSAEGSGGLTSGATAVGTTDTADGAWGAVSDLLAPQVDQSITPPLAASQARLTQSAATREAIAALLATAPMVDQP
ncbi:hypothetical protein [Pseudotabrizicola sp. 4114]|uniref:hypothetical protein n=1 Tax=Pseudotabrizicola sp. 4114 TaxID=2817731 RepID=UPI00285C0325|nr:tetratricopeptide (TPR) repeat protein [Pseudorhodobacter sp. 4114]